VPEAKEEQAEPAELRGWLLELARATMLREGGSDVAHDMDHILRVMNLAETIQRREGGELSVIWAAVALHDIGQERERRQGGDPGSAGGYRRSSPDCGPATALSGGPGALRCR
jgi:uncharacterized protein